MGEGHGRHRLGLPRTDILLGRMVTAPSATSSRRSTGALLEPQLSEPIQKKWPVWLALRAASSTLLWGHNNPAQTCLNTQLLQARSGPSARILSSRARGYPCSQPQMIHPYIPVPLTAHIHPQAISESLTPDSQAYNLLCQA